MEKATESVSKKENIQELQPRRRKVSLIKMFKFEENILQRDTVDKLATEGKIKMSKLDAGRCSSI